MTLGNVWLGSMQLNEIADDQLMSLAAFTMTSVTLSVASVVDYATIRVSGATTETMNIYLVPAAGTAYCACIYNTSTSGQTGIFWQPDRPLFLYPGAQIKVGVSNGDATGQIYGSLMVLF